MGGGASPQLAASVNAQNKDAVAATSVPTQSAKQSNIQANKAAGDAWEQDVVQNQLPATQASVQPQITIKSNGPSGVKVRLDAVGTDKSTGDVKLTDAKASATAPLTANQQVGYPEIATHGGTVVGKGKPPYTGGTQIPPTTVDVVKKP